MRVFLGVGIMASALALALPVAAEEPAVASAPVVDASGEPAADEDPLAEGGSRRIGKLIVVGIVAATFLVFAGVAGANDRRQGDPPKV